MQIYQEDLTKTLKQYLVQLSLSLLLTVPLVCKKFLDQQFCSKKIALFTFQM